MKTAVNERLSGVLTQLRQAIDAEGADGPTDGELLRRYVATRDQAAFELLVWRHGAMVLHACRRLLSRPADAEDAFQATFLALVRRAGAISKREAVAGWLYTVGCRIALRARAAAARRSAGERQAQLSADARSLREEIDPVVWAEVRAALDAEINRLSAKLRDPFVLCYLEGLSNEAAARQLGVPKGTVLSRLARARDKLRDRLSQRGLALSGAALAAGLGAEATALAAPAPLVAATVKAAALVAAGQATAGVVSAPVAALTEGVLQAMFLSKLKTTTAFIVSIGLLAAGAGGFVCKPVASGQAALAQAPKQQAPPVRKPAPKDADSADEVQRRDAEARVRLAEKELTLRHTENSLRIAQIDLERAKAERDQALADLERFRHEAAAKQDQPKKDTPKKETPKPRTDPAVPPGWVVPVPKNPAAAKEIALPGIASADLIQLGTSYIDAIRDLETAKVKLAGLAAGQDPINQEVERVNYRAAERKMALLRAIIDGSLKGAQTEFDRVRELRRGSISVQEASQAETKVQMLQLILDSVK